MLLTMEWFGKEVTTATQTMTGTDTNGATPNVRLVASPWSNVAGGPSPHGTAEVVEDTVRMEYLVKRSQFHVAW
jgi:hypothetical protein